MDEIDASIGEAKLFIRSDPDDAPLTVSATYTEYRTDTVYPQPPECQRVISTTMPGVPGLLAGAPRVRAHYEEGQFTLRAPDTGCATRYATEPVAVSVKPKTRRRWATVAVVDQCVGWRGSASGHHFRLKPLGDNGRTMLFVARTPSRNGREDFNYKVSRAPVADDGSVALGSTLRRGVLRVKTTHYPRERVYGFKPNGEINDRYWNYCVNEGKKVWMHNGNPYCIDPAFTYRRVRLRR